MASKKKRRKKTAAERRLREEARYDASYLEERAGAGEYARSHKSLKSRGLSGTPEEHAAAFNRAIHYARKPISFGCTTAQRSFGTAIAHYESAPSMRRHEALLEAERILDQTCLCKRG